MSTDCREYQAKICLKVALATFSGHLHKYISELVGLGFDWKVIKSKTQERFSEFGSSIVAQNKLTSFTQNTMAIHEYISELVSWNMLIASSQQTQLVQYWHQTLLMGYKLRSYTTQNLSEFYGFALKEDQKQKIRELDFCINSFQQQTIAHCDINIIKGSGCYKCGGNDHFIKDCPQNRDNSKSYNGLSNVHQKQYSSYKDQNKSGDNDSLEKSIQTMTDLLKTFIKKTSLSHSTYYKPSQKYPASRNSDQRQSYRNSNQNPHNRGHHLHHRNNTRINEMMNVTYLFKLVKELTKHCGTQEHTI